MGNAREALGLTIEDGEKLLDMDFIIKARPAESGEGVDTDFRMDMEINYKNMTRLQFQFYELNVLKMWEAMNKTQSAINLPELCDLDNPCEAE